MNSKPLSRFGVFVAISTRGLVFVLVRPAFGEPELERELGL